MVFHHLVVAHAGRTKMQSEDAGFSASSLSAHERYWVDTPARGCLMGQPPFLRGLRSAAAHAPQARMEIGEAPPVADEASRFRGSSTIGAPERARKS